MPITIRDIAEDAGVSVATVSRVLNGSSVVSPELRVRVQASVSRLGFQPNLLARSLRTQRTALIGVVIPNLSNPYFTDIARAIEDTALEAGYVVTVGSSDQDLDREQRYLQVLRKRMVDGALVAVADRERSDLSPLTDAGIPVVLIDRCLEGAELDTVSVDTSGGAYAAVTYLVERGYRRIATIAGPSTVSTAVAKLEGYRRAVRDHGLPQDEGLVAMGDYTEASGTALARRLLHLSEPPDAILAANNLMTVGLYSVVREYGLRIPHDVAIVGFDDARWATLVTPPITLVDQPTYELGQRATELLLRPLASGKTDGLARTREEIVLRPRLIVRGSC